MKNITFGYTDTNSTKKNLSRADLNFNKDYSITTEDENLTVVTNLTTPIDQPETIRWQIQDVANIYQGSGIDPSVFGTSKRGFSLVTQVNSVVRVTDDSDANFQIDLPVSAHIVLKAPKNQYVTGEILEQAVLRAVAALYDTGSDNMRLNSLVRGAMTPPSM